MSVTVKDHRRYVDGKVNEEQEDTRPKQLLQQVEIAKETGDPRLDKMLRHIAAKIEEHDARCTKIALEVAMCFDDKMLRVKQGEFYFNKGIIAILTDLAGVPQSIINEEQPKSNLVN